MTGRRGSAIGAGAGAAALVVALIVVVAGAESPPSASEALARAKRFVSRADSVEYRGESRFAYHDPEFPEDDYTDESAFEESAVFPDRSRLVIEYGGFVSESVAIEDVTYDRSAADRDSLEDELWTKYDPDATEASEDEGLFNFSELAVGGLSVAPVDLPLLIEEARRPRILAQRDGRTLVRTHVDTSEFESVYFPRVKLDLEVEDDGRITALRLEGSDAYETDRTQVKIERWDHDVRIDAPSDADIDPTPNLDEEDIAAYDDAELVQPRSIPVGWSFESATLVPEGDFAVDEEAPCAQVNLYFFNSTLLGPDGVIAQGSLEGGGHRGPVPLEDSTYLGLYLFPASCAEDRPRAAEDFTAGSYSGWFEDEDGYLYGQIMVGDTVIEFDTDLPEQDLTAILGDLVPLDFANPPAATIPLS